MCSNVGLNDLERAQRAGRHEMGRRVQQCLGTGSEEHTRILCTVLTTFLYAYTTPKLVFEKEKSEFQGSLG